MSQVLPFPPRGPAASEVAAPRDFVRQVADALAHLHDVPHLQTYPLSRRLAFRIEATDGLGRALQQALMDAIEGLRPARRSPPERSGRIHRLLVLRHVEGLEPATVWGQLGIGKSEYYREHSRGIDAVASVLFDQLNSGERSARAEQAVETTAMHEPPPRPLSSFVGRERELADLQELLGRARLVTLTGPPGTGKTRLALQIADRVQLGFAHGVVFVALGAIANPDLVLPTVAQTLRLQEETGHTALEQLVRALSGRELLLVLDNFEHVISASTQLSALLGASPRLRVVVTSRELLRISGEHAYTVAPLNDREAVQLFAERARATRADFELTAENATVVSAICARVDRLPLAIELAAGRVGVVGPTKLLALLERRLPLLSGGPRDLPPRQQTLDATIGWSYDLLDAADQALLFRMSVFVGGCTVEAIQALWAGDVLDRVSALVAKSLVLQEPGLGGEPRFRMLETIREFALDRLDQSGHGSAARRAHALYFRALTEQAEAEYLGPFDADWLDLLEQEYPNIRAAIDWSLGAGETDVALALPGALWRFFYHRAYMAEGREFLRLALAAATPTVAAPSPALARALFADASLAVWQGESASGRTHAEASVAMWRALGDKRGEAQALHTLGHTLVEHAAERDRYAESLTRFREVDDLCGQAWALHCLGNVTLLLGEVDAAQAIHTEALAIARRAESPGSISAALTGLGSVAVQRGDHARAYELYLEGFELRRSTSDRAMTDQLNVLGRAALGMGDTDLASAHFRESLEMSHKQGTKWDAAFALAGLAEVAMSTGNASHAARLYSASDALLEALGAKRSTDDQAEHQRTIQAVNDALGEPVFQQASASGRAMSHDEAIAFALNEYQPRT